VAKSKVRVMRAFLVDVAETQWASLVNASLALANTLARKVKDNRECEERFGRLECKDRAPRSALHTDERVSCS
jgi:hypothetical protein